ncbi:MAG: adenosylcobinamide-phosphate synthase CbiB [Nitrospirota bacterium]
MEQTTQYFYSLLTTNYSLLVLAYFLDIAIGDPKWLPHPVRIMGRAITSLEDFLRFSIQSIEQGAKSKENFEKLAGVFLVMVIIGLTYGLSYIIDSALLTSHFSFLTSYFSLLVMVYLISTTLATKGLIDSARTVIEALKSRNIEAARENLHHIVGRDTDSPDEKGVLRATIESLAENASDGIIAPLFYFAIGGLPLAMTYKAINTMDSMVGYKNGRYRYFDWAAARLDDIANYIPARITGVLIATASSILNWSLVTKNNAS